MNNSETRTILIDTLQKVLTNNLRSTSTVNPQWLADAIISKVNFSKTCGELTNEKLVNLLVSIIMGLKNEMKDELKALKPDEKLLANFIHGKLTAYNEMLNTLNTV